MEQGHGFETNVFVNCPFDSEYDRIRQAILFCLIRFGLNPRIATERSDSGETRIEKILELVESSRFSIHDLSRCQARQAGEHYRLNMPFELGIDFGCRRFGPNLSRTKYSLFWKKNRIAIRLRSRILQVSTSNRTMAIKPMPFESFAIGSWVKANSGVRKQLK